jgi:dTDP-4-amino-4,6-dideoxygalactose transaminase
MDPILDVAREYNLIVVEDACQAHGAEYFSRAQNRWRKAGSMGVAAAFSFYPGKNLGACGEAGAAVTHSELVARKMRLLRDHGQSKKYYHDLEGYNGRLDSIQAAILSAKLRYLAEWNQKRRALARRYDEMLAGVPGVITPHTPEWSRAVYHLYVVRVKDRSGLQAHLSNARVDTSIHYPIPLHLQKAYANYGYQAGDFPATERVAAEILSLPMYPQLTEIQQNRVVEQISRFASARHSQTARRQVPAASAL